LLVQCDIAHSYNIPVARRPQIIAQSFDTTLAERVSGAQVRFVTLPSRSIEGALANVPIGEFLPALGLRSIGMISNTFEIVDWLREQLTRDYDLDAGFQFTTRQLSQYPNDAEEFVRAVIFEDVVPFEESPLDLTSIAHLVQTASGVGIGAYAGFVVAGPTPLLFIALPVGMLIGGSAAGIARALEAGLEYRILRLMGVPESHGRRQK
jgi:hypothetical protein